MLGLGFGDCGKGRAIDTLTRRWQAHTIVRFSGGAQAGHNVVAAAEAGAPGRHHTFSQFAAGTLVPATRSLLLDPMVLHPTGLLAEAEALSRIGIGDALSRVLIDGQCRITTPFHQAAGRLRELARGTAAHGTCGIGVGETVRLGLEKPELTLRYGELSPATAAQARVLVEKLQEIRETLLAEFLPPDSVAAGGKWGMELQALRDEFLAARWLSVARALARQCVPASTAMIATQLTRPGCVLFEGAQGVLLDEWRGFHPHTTWSSITTAAVESAVARFHLAAPFEHYGVLRTYLTRHGAGPLPTYDVALDDALPEPHNLGDGWQGRFRRGHPDSVLLRYALAAVGSLSGLIVTHLDVFQRGISLRWCERYAIDSPSANQSFVDELPVGALGDLQHQATLTKLLENALPQYSENAIESARKYLERLAGVTELPVILRSYGSVGVALDSPDRNRTIA